MIDRVFVPIFYLMKRAALMIILFTFALSWPLFAQNNCTIVGDVRDQHTGKTIPDVEVYIAKSTYGTTTGKKGHYRLTHIPSGVLFVVFTSIGYKTICKRIILPEGCKAKINTYLTPQTYKLREILVTGSRPKKWKKRLSSFEEDFLGFSEYSNRSVIKNPEVLNFRIDRKTGELIAYSDSTLIVVNKALGYRLYIQLSVFRWYQGEGTLLIYPLFEEMKPSSKEQLGEWKVNRREAYKSSFRHFLYTLAHNKARKEGFGYDYGIRKLSEEDNKKELTKRGMPHAPLTGFKISINVKVHYDFRDSEIIKNDEDYFFVDSYGNMLNPISVSVSGYWSLFRVGSLLPFDYRPDD